MKYLALFLILTFSTAVKVNNNYPAGSIVATHGKLQVKGLQLVNKNGVAIQLRGVSTHGPQWFENCYSLESFTALVRDWKTDLIRIAMYVTEGGYNNKPDYWKAKVVDYVKWAGQLGVYCLIDWHVMNPGDPLDAQYNQRFDFFKTMTFTFANSDHVMYEIANEPNNVQWSQVENYANIIIPFIRRFDSNSVIMIGTPQWSSDLPSVNPVIYYNTMYSFHFYAASHYTQQMFATQAGRIPIFVTEYGTCEYTGNGKVDTNNANAWVQVFNGANSGNQKISFVNWAFSDCNESCAALSPGSCANKAWSSVTISGQWVKSIIQQAH